MVFDAPTLLLAAPLVALGVFALAWWARSARVRHARRWSEELAGVARRTNRGGALLLAVAAAAATVAAAGPRWGRRVVTTETEALDLVIAVDISRSMLAADAGGDRLGRARGAAGRLVHDLAGDRIGLIAFAGRSFILSPLTVDGSALHLLVDALHPDMASAGGTSLHRALRQGGELLRAGDRIADRVLVVFTDGEAHDSLPDVLDAAEALRRDGMHLILVAEGSDAGARIPVRDADGAVVDWQRDEAGAVVVTRRRDDILTAVADAAHGVVVAAQLEDQASAVRNVVAAYKRAPQSTSAASHDVPRAWIPALVALALLLLHAMTRRTAALAAFTLLLAGSAQAQGPRNPADEAWRAGAFAQAASLYLEQARAGAGGDTAWYNAGTALLAQERLDSARTVLERAATSLDPDLRFRALYNLGLASLRQATRDSLRRDEHLAAARRWYREALLLRPHDRDAKWNLELAVSRSTPPPAGGGGAPPAGGGQQGTPPPRAPDPQRLTPEQARQILESIAAEERETRLDVTRRGGRPATGFRGRDW